MPRPLFSIRAGLMQVGFWLGTLVLFQRLVGPNCISSLPMPIFIPMYVLSAFIQNAGDRMRVTCQEMSWLGWEWIPGAVYTPGRRKRNVISLSFFFIFDFFFVWERYISSPYAIYIYIYIYIYRWVRWARHMEHKTNLPSKKPWSDLYCRALVICYIVIWYTSMSIYYNTHIYI
jgi:hypothetical protein